MPSLAARLGLAPQARALIVTCDDLGFLHAANVAICGALRQGVATSASLMVPAPGREVPYTPIAARTSGSTSL
jgi:hypothetical protein